MMMMPRFVERVLNSQKPILRCTYSFWVLYAQINTKAEPLDPAGGLWSCRSRALPLYPLTLHHRQRSGAALL